MNASSPLLEARRLGRRTADADDWLLRDVTLSIRSGERVALSGPTGSGKTLLMRAVALLDPLDGGEVLWCGRPIAGHDVPRYRASAIYLHQRPALTGPRVEAALRQPFTLGVHHQRTFDRERIVAWLGRLGRDDRLLDRPVSELSGGERQIVALLRAVQLEPSVLLLDEPTAALDPSAVEAVEQLVAAWFDEAPAERALLWVSHDAAQAGRVADRVVEIEQGEIV
jgi:putative ABC transport system ATP-binding protein